MMPQLCDCYSLSLFPVPPPPPKQTTGEEDLALLFSKLGITTQKGIPTKIPISELLGLAKGVGPDGKPTEVTAIHTL